MSYHEHMIGAVNELVNVLWKNGIDSSKHRREIEDFLNDHWRGYNGAERDWVWLAKELGLFDKEREDMSELPSTLVEGI